MVEQVVVTIERPGSKAEAVDFKGEGWKYKHLRVWEDAMGAGATAAVVSERIQAWHLLDEDGKEIPFKPGKGALDELPPETARWLVGLAFLEAYRRAGTPDPNA